MNIFGGGCDEAELWKSHEVEVLWGGGEGWRDGIDKGGWIGMEERKGKIRININKKKQW